MAAVTEDEQGASGTLDRGEKWPVLAEAEHSLSASEQRPGCTKGAWRVVVQVRERLISRSVWYGGSVWSPGGDGVHSDGQHSSEVIWPTWPSTLGEEIATSGSPLEDLQRGWDATMSRLRDSAKWMAAVLGAAPRRTSSRSCAALSLHLAPPAPIDARAGRPPAATARRHRFADIRDTRKCGGHLLVTGPGLD